MYRKGAGFDWGDSQRTVDLRSFGSVRERWAGHWFSCSRLIIDHRFDLLLVDPASGGRHSTERIGSR